MVWFGDVFFERRFLELMCVDVLMCDFVESLENSHGIIAYECRKLCLC